VTDRGIDTVVDAFYVDTEEAVEIGFACSLDGAYVRDAGIIHENIEAAQTRQLAEDFPDARLIGNIARVRLGIAAGGGNFLS
jgi:hypothetical protein